MNNRYHDIFHARFPSNLYACVIFSGFYYFFHILATHSQAERDRFGGSGSFNRSSVVFLGSVVEWN
jgi:hypothetical protein